MGKAQYLVQAHLKEGTSVAELARIHGVHRSWIYKLLARYRADGEDGLCARSRRPKSSPKATCQQIVDRVVDLRLELDEQGHDAGPQTICWHLEKELGSR